MGTFQDTVAQLYEVLHPYTKDGQVVTEDTELVTDLGLDSMKVMQIVLEAEERFDISIPLNVLPDIRTVRDFAQKIEELTSQRT